jgi:hypothetical protein
MGDGTSGRRAGPTARIAFVSVAVLVSGCFHAGPSVKQAMTSAAPSLPIAAPAGTQGAAAVATRPVASIKPHPEFDLDKPEVATSVAVFQTDLRGFFDGALERGAKYVPTMTDILTEEGLPPELAYLPLIESGYRPLAVSPAGAVGPWQFIPETGKRYGLRIDAMVDERRDPIKSTHAAVQYLRDLHEMFGDWQLSLAAYNSGENRVARIVADTGVGDFWSMRDGGYLPDETSAYVPRFLAAVRIAAAPERYGFESPAHVPFHFETVHVDRPVSLRAAAGLCGVSASELAELNPALRQGITPTGYALRVPTGRAEPLRMALATYVEPARPNRAVARATRAGGRKSRLARAGARTAPAFASRGPKRQRQACAGTPRTTADKGARRRGATTADARRRDIPALVRLAIESPRARSGKPPPAVGKSKRRAR